MHQKCNSHFVVLVWASHTLTICVCIWRSVLVHWFLPTLLCKTKVKRRTLAFLFFFQPCETGGSEEAHKKNFVVQPTRAMKSCFQTQFRKLFLNLKKTWCSFSWQRSRKMWNRMFNSGKRSGVSQLLASRHICLICYIFEMDFFFLNGCSQNLRCLGFVFCTCCAHVWITLSRPLDYAPIRLNGGVGEIFQSLHINPTPEVRFATR